jgi:GTP diphosphokinase / guanosine-3',5'-bis(diphosphate) 3'-diphosphatase
VNRKEFFTEVANVVTPYYLQKMKWAYELGKDLHRINPDRIEGGRYFDHPRAVDCILLKYGEHSPKSLIVGLLHDVVEDCFVPQNMLVRLFGNDIARGVHMISKVTPVFDCVTGEITRKVKKSNAEYFGSLVLSKLWLQRCKVADRLHNLSTMPLEIWGKQKCLEYVQESDEFISPMARKVGRSLAKAYFQEFEAQKVRVAKLANSL